MTVLTVVGAERPPGGIKAGVVITAEGGIEGTQVYRYDAEGKPMAGTPAKSRTANPLPRSSSALTASKARYVTKTDARNTARSRITGKSRR